MTNAPPLVLLHGFLGAPSSWDPVVAALRTERATVRPWLPGHGPAPWTPTTPSFDAAVDGLAASWPSGPVVAVGYSMGARVLLALLARGLPCARAILVGVHPGLTDAKARAERRNWDDDWARRVEREGIDRFVDAWRVLSVLQPHAPVPPARAAAQDRARRAHLPRGIAFALRHLGLGAMPFYGEALACPDPTEDRSVRAGRSDLTLVTGAHDPKFAAIAKELAAANPALERVTLPCAHNPLLECPDAIARVIEGREAAPPPPSPEEST